MTDDQAIIARVLGGDTNAFRLLVDRYQKPVISIVANLLNDRDAAEDLSQDAFLAAYRHLGAFDPARSAFSTWLFTIARNKSINATRKRRVAYGTRDVPAIDWHGPADDLAREDFYRQLDGALDGLPEHQRTAFVLAEIIELSYEDIAQIEGVRIGTVRSRINRAKAKLRASLEAKREVGA